MTIETRIIKVFPQASGVKVTYFLKIGALEIQIADEPAAIVPRLAAMLKTL